MEEADQFHPTLWPGATEVPVPPVYVSPVRSVVDGAIVLGAPSTEFELPVDFLVQEAADLESASDEAIAEFTQAFGCFAYRHWATSWSAGSDLPLDGWTHLHKTAFPTVQALVKANPGLAAVQDVVTFDDIRFRAQTLAALTRHWQVHINGRWQGQSITDRERELIAVWSAHPVSKPSTGEQAWRDFADYLNAALQPFHPRVTPAMTGQMVTGYNAACLQLFNHMATGKPFKTCEREKCGRLYYLQRGPTGEIAKEHRTIGTKYCSNRCAKANAERERRVRIKEQRKRAANVATPAEGEGTKR